MKITMMTAFNLKLAIDTIDLVIQRETVDQIERRSSPHSRRWLTQLHEARSIMERCQTELAEMMVAPVTP